MYIMNIQFTTEYINNVCAHVFTIKIIFIQNIIMFKCIYLS